MSTIPKPILNEVFADNGAHSHWEVIDANNGKILWSEELATDGREELEKRVAKLENEIIRVTDIAILCYASRIHTLDEKEFTKEIDKFKLEMEVCMEVFSFSKKKYVEAPIR